MTSRTLTFGGTSYPLVLPTSAIRGSTSRRSSSRSTSSARSGSHFRVSVPQILAAILTCAVIEIALTFRQSRAFVWPASAMLTGSGVALILRVVGTPPDDPWNTYALVRLRGRCRLLAPHEVRHQVPRLARLQPVQHRAGRGVRRARQHARRAARLLVGAAQRLDDRGVRRDHRRRAADHRRLRSPRPSRRRSGSR